MASICRHLIGPGHNARAKGRNFLHVLTRKDKALPAEPDPIATMPYKLDPKRQQRRQQPKYRTLVSQLLCKARTPTLGWVITRPIDIEGRTDSVQREVSGRYF